jgi:CheY-like chemotaxis protein
MSASYLTTDLLFSSRVTSAAAACGLSLSVVADQSELLAQVATGEVHLVLLEFSMPGLDLLELVPQIRNHTPNAVCIIAFGPHVDVAGIAAARQAGCNAVYTRGQFSQQMAAILQKHGCTV